LQIVELVEALRQMGRNDLAMVVMPIDRMHLLERKKKKGSDDEADDDDDEDDEEDMDETDAEDEVKNYDVGNILLIDLENKTHP
jgi:hypothetical protein